MTSRPRVILLPGSVLPAELAYPPLIEALGPDVDAIAKELEVYAEPEPPAGYSLDDEVSGILREADARGWDRFHLVGYSGGGAASLAFAARHAERLSSLVLLEPAWAGSWNLSDAEQAIWQAHLDLPGLPPAQFLSEFTRLALKPGISPPARPAGDPPPWMAKRPAGIQAFLRTFETYDLDREALRRFDRPVLFVLGGLSNPDYYAQIGERLGRVFPDFEVKVFEDRHHFDPPHRVEPDRLAQQLERFWARA